MTAAQYESTPNIGEEVRQRAIDQHMVQICEEARERMGNIPWNSVAEMRTYLAHAYGSLRAGQVWDTVVGGEPAGLCDACAACADETVRGGYAPAHRSRTAERRAAGRDE